MLVVFLTSDLLAASRVEGAARLAGADLQMASTLEAAVARCIERPIDLLIVDLASAGSDVAALVDRVTTQAEHRPTIVAFGPHVHEALLEAARAAGCDQVLTRGNFMAGAQALFAGRA